MKNAKTSIIRLLTALIPAKGLRRRIRRRLMDAERDAWLAKNVPEARRRYARLEAACREKLAAGGRLSVAFVVCDASMFSGESVFQAMLGDSRFDPFIAVVPRVSRGEEFLKASLEKTLSSLRAKFGDAVRCMYDPATGAARPLEGAADVVFTSIVYQDQTLEQYTTVRLSRTALVVCLYYGYGGLFKSNERKTVFLPDIVCSWRYFVSNEATRRLWVERNPALAGNTVAAGYCKMDRLARIPASAPRTRARIIVAPHHTIDRKADALSLSTFLEHADFFLRLPEMFPEADFVFRPHPLLFARLATPKWWGPERTAEYERRMKAHANVEFQQGGDYFGTFAESDALVHDCGSFLAEYFYTGRPQCYLSDGKGTLEAQLLPFSERLYANVYHATTDDEIAAFVRDVAIAGRDPMKPARDEFAAAEVCVNHPNATARVIDAVMNGIEKGTLT